MFKISYQVMILAAILLWSVTASSATHVIINGYQLNDRELASLEAQLGTRVTPGYYLVDYRSGCWINQSNGQRGCLGNSGSYTSRYGSGERNSRGDWSHWSDYAGGSVGGTGDGCVYAFGWSNC
jgi:hypothetical protein